VKYWSIALKHIGFHLLHSECDVGTTTLRSSTTSHITRFCSFNYPYTRALQQGAGQKRTGLSYTGAVPFDQVNYTFHHGLVSWNV